MGKKDGLTDRSGTTGPFWAESFADALWLCLGSSETKTEGFLVRSNWERRIGRIYVC